MQAARHRRTCVPLLLCLALVCKQSRADFSTVQPARRLLTAAEGDKFGVCGGSSCGFPGATDNALVSCPTGYGCHRNSAKYWMCLPGAPPLEPYIAPVASASSPPPPPPSPPPPSPTPLPVALLLETATQNSTGVNCTGCTVPIEGWRQCGGESNCAPNATCLDAQWPHSCCVQGFTCTRAYKWYWQCLPSTSPPLEVASPSPPQTQILSTLALSARTSSQTLPSPLPTSVSEGHDVKVPSMSTPATPVAAASPAPEQGEGPFWVTS